jgi:catechol 2,3-dioxygenase-like lactoylglutathione lyase family enzyme
MRSLLKRVAAARRAALRVGSAHTRRVPGGFDHVGITVADLDAATAFFVGLGLEVEGRMFVEGKFVDTVIGIPDSRSEMVMLRPPDGGTGLEPSSVIREAVVGRRDHRGPGPANRLIGRASPQR